MCGRCRFTLRADGVPTACYRNHPPSRTINLHMNRQSYNVSPGSSLPVIRQDAATDGSGTTTTDGCRNNNNYAVHCMKWGLIPSFTKKTDKPDFYKMFNARSETLKEKASFRRLLPKNRCLVAVEGFYEWKKDGSKKQPYYVHFKDGRPLVFAALYDSWKNSEDETLYTFTIITTSSSSTLQWLHDRMPVILGDKASTDAWLMDSSSSAFEGVLKPYESSDLGWYPVTSAMGKPSFDTPECVQEIQLKMEVKNPISKFFTTKHIKQEEETKSMVKCSIDKPAETEQLDSMKEESDINVNKYKPTETLQLCSVKVESSTDNNINKPDETNQLESVKEELDIDDDKQISAGKADLDSKLKDTMGKSQVKRDFKEFAEDSKGRTGKTDKGSKSPIKKKKIFKGPGDKKQPTLLAFFGKK
ncbi:hypothetical protein ACFE04_001050 [Oxalis oulophora]